MIDEGIINIEKNKIAIIVVGFNKFNGLSRLLDSLNNADYPEDNVPLVISIDASGNQRVYDMVREFRWNHGTKYVNIEKDRLGLKNHIFQCASLTKYFKAVVILEDDIMVSPNFYNYCIDSLIKYGDDSNVAGVALYKNETNGFVGLPIQPYANEYDVFAMQSVCSWGEMWNERMWNEFTAWMAGWNEDFVGVDMPERIKNWTRAWSKYYYAYLIENDKYFIYPYQSLTTNFNDAGGEHGGGNSSVVQVSLQFGKRDYKMGDFKDLVKYDVYGQNMELPAWLGIDPSKLTIDYYGLKSTYNGRYLLTTFVLPYKRVKGFALSMRPWELNIMYDIAGDEIILYDRGTTEIVLPPKRVFNITIARYYLRDFNIQLLRCYIWDGIKNSIKRKLYLKKK